MESEKQLFALSSSAAISAWLEVSSRIDSTEAALDNQGN
jgi:hypothetical protein